MNPEPFDVLAVELSSYQLHWSRSISAQASAVLNVAPDHIDWHGGFDAYAADKARIYENTQVACVYNAQDPATERMVEEADVVEGCRAIGFTLGIPAAGMIGLVDDAIADRAFIAGRVSSAAELGSISDIGLNAHGDAGRVPPPHVIANALAAAALARAHGVEPRAVRDGLRSFRTDAHRIAEVAQIGGVRWVDDSKATNAHAAQASLRGVRGRRVGRRADSPRAPGSTTSCWRPGTGCGRRPDRRRPRPDRRGAGATRARRPRRRGRHRRD